MLECMFMATEEGPIPPGDEYPPAALPTVYADGVLNLVNNPNTVKFYLYRLDANLSGGHASKVQPFAQVVMPLNGFLDTVIFFDRMLDKLVAEGVVPEKLIEEMRAYQEKAITE